ncbi:hypothetical protein Syun_026105 [Stephania yunnanensis]|uniref:Uncharacterized protein n=1 Tax=Stephania yunnanensis TaxID=152371 RepID=A0AAP0HWQ7_9MAGN
MAETPQRRGRRRRRRRAKAREQRADSKLKEPTNKHTAELLVDHLVVLLGALFGCIFQGDISALLSFMLATMQPTTSDYVLPENIFLLFHNNSNPQSSKGKAPQLEILFEDTGAVLSISLLFIMSANALLRTINNVKRLKDILT